MTYTVYELRPDGRGVARSYLVGRNLPLEAAVVLVEGLLRKYSDEPLLTYTIKRELDH